MSVVVDRHHSYGPHHLDVRRELVAVTATDRAETTGTLHTGQTRSRTALLVMHPRGDFSRHYLAPLLARAGYAVLCQTSRHVNNDIDAVQERTLLDVAAGLRALRDLGYEHLLLIGNSGGGALTSLYQREAMRSGDDRLATDASGWYPVPLAGEDMPVADGMVHLAAHVGEGHFMQKVIDPAVVDEDQPILSNPELDLYHPDNGYVAPPASSSYAYGWLDAYRSAQTDRCRRVDAHAWALLARQRSARLAGTDTPDRRRARDVVEYLVVYRTLADPAYVDLSIDPSDRLVGSVFATDPFLGNHGRGGLGRVMTARGWLSTWSPTYSRADMRTTLSEVDCPTLFVNATADTEVRPAEFAEIVAASAASDKSIHTLLADHYFRTPSDLGEGPRTELTEVVVDWLARRFPA